MNHRGTRGRIGRSSGRHPLSAAVVAALLAIAHSHAHADTPHANGTIVVTNCNDNGVGSLRQAIAEVPDGGTVDLSALTCSAISLSGHLHVNQDDLDIIGPGSGALTINANSVDRAFVHAGLGVLTLDDLRIANGEYHGGTYYKANGGCLFSSGTLSLNGVTISGCLLTSELDPGVGGVKRGGCVAAMDSATLVDTRVEACTAIALDDEELDGGGVYASGQLIMLDSAITGVRCRSGITLGIGANSIGGFTMKYSTIENNLDTGDAALGFYSQGGGVQANAPVYVHASTIAQNDAWTVGGTLFFGEPIDIRNSTVASNSAVERGGISLIESSDTTITNSTIAFNHGDGSTAGGITIYNTALQLVSTIVANNTSGAAARDIGASGVSSLSGFHNLVPFSLIAMPADTLTEDPALLPLYANGGTTRTLALSPGSPAIDVGDNSFGFDNDQRGTGFERLVGNDVDIGAIEYRAEDSDPVFWNGFES